MISLYGDPRIFERELAKVRKVTAKFADHIAATADKCRSMGIGEYLAALDRARAAKGGDA